MKRRHQPVAPSRPRARFVAASLPPPATLAEALAFARRIYLGRESQR